MNRGYMTNAPWP